MQNKKTKFTVEEIINKLQDEEENRTIEGELLRTKLIRELYKQLGAPKEEEFPDEYRVAGRYWEKFKGYTTYIYFAENERWMEIENGAPTTWRITYASQTKREIVEEYTRAGWHCEVQAYNVLCSKYVKHPRYKNLWVRFYSTRDCNKYEYVIVRKENEQDE